MTAEDRYVLRDAYVLHRRNYRETSLLLDVFSRDLGTLRLMAKGALRGARGKSTILQVFLPLSLGWTARGEPAVLTVAEPRGNSFRLFGRALYCGFYLNELLLKLVPFHDPHPRVFELYENSISRLQDSEEVDETLRFFEMVLLEEIGYGLALDHDIETGKAIRPDRSYLYRIEQGPVESSGGDDLVRGTTLLGLRDGRLRGPDEVAEAKRLMRRIINHHLEGRPLRSRELFKYMRSNE